jgi:hypothetical protein
VLYQELLGVVGLVVQELSDASLQREVLVLGLANGYMQTG